MEKEVTVSGAKRPDGSLYDVRFYLSWSPGDELAVLDGEFTAQELREIADHMDATQAVASERAEPTR